MKGEGRGAPRPILFIGRKAMRPRRPVESREISITAFLTACIIILLAAVCSAGTIVRAVDFARPAVTYKASTCVISVENSPTFANPGEPLLPSYAIRVLLPQGEEVSGISISASEEEEIKIDLPLEWGQPQAPLSMDASWERVLADPEIYESNEPFPTMRAIHVTTQTYKGYNLAFFRVYPVTYVGAENVLRYSAHLELTIETRASEAMLRRSHGTLRAGVSNDVSEVKRVIGEDLNLTSYVPPERLSQPPPLVDPADTYPFVIITTATLEPVFETLKEVKDQRGMITKIVRIQHADSANRVELRGCRSPGEDQEVYHGCLPPLGNRVRPARRR
jgi:hypothetical protein